jgi:hypothetical protein
MGIMTNEARKRYMYAGYRESVLAKLTRLTEYYQDPKVRDLSTKNWGHVGTTVRVDEELTELMKFLVIPTD